MNTATHVSRRGETQASLDRVKCAHGDSSVLVDASHILALAESWERLAEWEDKSCKRAVECRDLTSEVLRADSATTYRRHAAALRELVDAAVRP